jgi:hypothetical protein
MQYLDSTEGEARPAFQLTKFHYLGIQYIVAIDYKTALCFESSIDL